MIQIAMPVVENNRNCYLVPFLHPSFLCPLFTADEEKASWGKRFIVGSFSLWLQGFLGSSRQKGWDSSMYKKAFLSESA